MNRTRAGLATAFALVLLLPACATPVGAGAAPSGSPSATPEPTATEPTPEPTPDAPAAEPTSAPEPPQTEEPAADDPDDPATWRITTSRIGPIALGDDIDDVAALLGVETYTAAEYMEGCSGITAYRVGDFVLSAAGTDGTAQTIGLQLTEGRDAPASGPRTADGIRLGTANAEVAAIRGPYTHPSFGGGGGVTWEQRDADGASLAISWAYASGDEVPDGRIDLFLTHRQPEGGFPPCID